GVAEGARRRERERDHGMCRGAAGRARRELRKDEALVARVKRYGPLERLERDGVRPGIAERSHEQADGESEPEQDQRSRTCHKLHPQTTPSAAVEVPILSRRS